MLQSGTVMMLINVGDMVHFLVPIPPTISEQTAIANALSDTDALIQSLEKLIDKKRDIKKGAMQELLKPKASWEIMTLGDVGTFSKGSGIKKDESQSGNIPCVRYGEIYTRHDDFIKEYYSYISIEVAKTSKRLKKAIFYLQDQAKRRRILENV
jgi:type I restriction enzyme S subunit